MARRGLTASQPHTTLSQPLLSMRGFCIAASLTLASAFVAPTSVSRMGRSAQPTTRAAAASGSMEELRRFTPADARAAAETYGTPCYLYSLAELRKQADAVRAAPPCPPPRHRLTPFTRRPWPSRTRTGSPPGTP